MDKLLDTFLLMLEGSEITLEIFFVTLIIALPLGMLAALAIFAMDGQPSDFQCSRRSASGLMVFCIYLITLSYDIHVGLRCCPHISYINVAYLPHVSHIHY